jgi:hypothetical protein
MMIFLFSDRMSDTTFINIVMVMAATRQYEWAEQFIEDYKQYLEAYIQPSAVPLAKAVLLHNSLNLRKSSIIFKAFVMSIILMVYAVDLFCFVVILRW